VCVLECFVKTEGSISHSKIGIAYIKIQFLASPENPRTSPGPQSHTAVVSCGQGVPALLTWSVQTPLHHLPFLILLAASPAHPCINPAKKQGHTLYPASRQVKLHEPELARIVTGHTQSELSDLSPGLPKLSQDIQGWSGMSLLSSPRMSAQQLK
jgi:hypothetical protein